GQDPDRRAIETIDRVHKVAQNVVRVGRRLREVARGPQRETRAPPGPTQRMDTQSDPAPGRRRREADILLVRAPLARALEQPIDRLRGRWIAAERGLDRWAVADCECSDQ